MIVIVDYGLGNVRAFANVYHRLGIPHCAARTAGDLMQASKILLPGVGAFDHAMALLDGSGMRPALDELVLKRRIPVLGVCVGMQILACASEEGRLQGLGWVDGVVRKHVPVGLRHKTQLPHMGWNRVVPLRCSGLLDGLPENALFYFLHSFCLHCANPQDVVAETDYGGPIASVVNAGNVFGIQCHPEKSHDNGVRLLRNFALL